jgi:hypothetical protein
VCLKNILDTHSPEYQNIVYRLPGTAEQYILSYRKRDTCDGTRSNTKRYGFNDEMTKNLNRFGKLLRCQLPIMTFLKQQKPA